MVDKFNVVGRLYFWFSVIQISFRDRWRHLRQSMALFTTSRSYRTDSVIVEWNEQPRLEMRPLQKKKNVHLTLSSSNNTHSTFHWVAICAMLTLAASLKVIHSFQRCVVLFSFYFKFYFDCKWINGYMRWIPFCLRLVLDYMLSNTNMSKINVFNVNCRVDKVRMNWKVGIEKRNCQTIQKMHRKKLQSIKTRSQRKCFRKINFVEERLSWTLINHSTVSNH